MAISLLLNVCVQYFKFAHTVHLKNTQKQKMWQYHGACCGFYVTKNHDISMVTYILHCITMHGVFNLGTVQKIW